MESALASYRKQRKIKQSALGAMFGVQAPAVSKWEQGRIPAERVLDVERATGIPRSKLRPDLYPAATEAAE